MDFLGSRLIEYWSQNLQPLVSVLVVNLAWSIIIAVASFYVARRARSSFLRAVSRTRADAHTRFVGGQVVYVTVLVIGFAAILGVFGVSPAALVTVAGALGVAMSLATQDILKNFFVGLYLLFERPFRVGDVITVKDYRGVVEDIGIRAISLRTEDNAQVLVPNSLIFNEIITNRSHFSRVESSQSAPVLPDGGAGSTAAGRPASG